MRYLLSASLIAISVFAALPASGEIPPIPRVLPPEGLEIPADVRDRLQKRLAETKKRMEPHQDHDLLPDVEIFTKAVELALIHREFYRPQDFAKADWALDQAKERLDSLDRGEAPWTKATGLVVRGYRSSIDNSAQPYGLVIPENHDFEKPCPLYVWLHGRGDKNTDLHFLQERATKVGQISPPGAIVLHPFGRQCVGYKHAGEIDVLDVTALGWKEYGRDKERVVLMGFSMGGAGAWHIGAHKAYLFTAVCPGAGFAETARYQRLTPDEYPPWYEQKLWGQYDAPSYVRNLFNTEVIAYSGELDKQIQAARVMEEAFRGEGRELTHLIGPGVEHRYEPDTLKQLMERLSTIVDAGKMEPSTTVHLQTRTLDYPGQKWVMAQRLQEHWEDARIDGEILGPKRIKLTTKNVSELVLSTWQPMAGTAIEIDGQRLTLADIDASDLSERTLRREEGEWKQGRPKNALVKNVIWHGPIDDAFKEKFWVVTPTGKSRNARFQAWVEFELEHFRRRWRALMRAELPEVRDVDVVADKVGKFFGNKILWGDADSNALIRHYQEEYPAWLPMISKDGVWELGSVQFVGNQLVPAMVYPWPELEMGKYVVYNSGLTFREGHDRTNSQQNPKLPDWAIIDITQPPDAFAPGRIHDAGFFDEEWKLKGPVKGP